MNNEKEVTLKSGKQFKIKIPPMSLHRMEHFQKDTVKGALVHPEMLAILTLDEFQELFILIADLNQKYWREQALNCLARGKRGSEL